MKSFIRIALFSVVLCATHIVCADEYDSPVLKDEWRNEVLASLNMDHPGLEVVKKLYASGDKKGAAAAYVKFLRSRKLPAYLTDGLRNYDKKRAAEGLNYTWRYGHTTYTFPNKKIDWYYNHTKHNKGRLDYEWQWQLNRMRWFKEMAGAYRESGNAEYVIAFVRQLRSWAVQCHKRPNYNANNGGSCWRGITCGLRLGNFWPPAYAGFINAKEFTDDDVITYCYLTLLQSRHLTKYNNTGNVLTMEMKGLYTFGLMFPEFKEAAPARKYAIKTMYDNIKIMMLPDGFLNELCNAYHSTVVGIMIAFSKLGEAYGRSDELPPDFLKLLEAAYDAQLRMTTPALDMPLTNDSRHFNMVKFFQEAVRRFPKRSDFLWVASNRKKGAPPNYLSTVMPWSGFVMMRQSWDADANYLVFDVGPLGARHEHLDKLNIAIWKGEDQLLYDDGGGNYSRSETRRYARFTWGHNLITVNNWSQAVVTNRANRILSKPVTGVLTSDGKVDFARGVYDQGWMHHSRKWVRHERQVMYIRPDIFLVYDRMVPTSKKTMRRKFDYQARWHVDTLKVSRILPDHPALISSPESSIQLPAQRGNPSGKRNKLIVAPLFTAGLKVAHVTGKVEGKADTLGGVYTCHPFRETTTITHSRSGKGVHEFLTLFIPLGNKEESPIRGIKQIDGKNAEVIFKNGKVLKVSIVKDVLKAELK